MASGAVIHGRFVAGSPLYPFRWPNRMGRNPSLGRDLPCQMLDCGIPPCVNGCMTWYKIGAPIAPFIVPLGRTPVGRCDWGRSAAKQPRARSN